MENILACETMLTKSPAAAAHFVPAEDPLKLSATDLQADTVVNVGSALVAAQQAIAGWAELPASVSKSFVYTGNFLNFEIMPALLANGIGKSAAAHLIKVASAAYADKGYQYVRSSNPRVP